MEDKEKGEKQSMDLEIEQIWKDGIELFGSKSAMELFLKQNNMFMNDEKPITLLKTSEGRSIVRSELASLKYSITG
jgi:uncharacterized protein (DUF2384 family)